MRSTVLAAAAALCLTLVAPGGAAYGDTWNYHGVIATGDDTTSSQFFALPATTCAAAPSVTGSGSHEFTYDQFAFRNDGTTSTCATVTGQDFGCPFNVRDVSLSPGGGLMGSDAPTCEFTHGHSFALDGKQPFVEQVAALHTGSDYELTVAGTDVVPVKLAAANNVSLPAGNTLNLTVSSLEDGTGVEGTLAATAGPGHRYSGPVRCLRVANQHASLVMTFDGSEQGLASKWKGAVYWLHQSLDGQSNGQRNSILDQHQLDTTYASCPDPVIPLGGRFNPLGADSAVRVVSNGFHDPS